MAGSMLGCTELWALDEPKGKLFHLPIGNLIGRAELLGDTHGLDMFFSQVGV